MEDKRVTVQKHTHKRSMVPQRGSKEWDMQETTVTKMRDPIDQDRSPGFLEQRA